MHCTRTLVETAAAGPGHDDVYHPVDVSSSILPPKLSSPSSHSSLSSLSSPYPSDVRDHEAHANLLGGVRDPAWDGSNPVVGWDDSRYAQENTRPPPLSAPTTVSAVGKIPSESSAPLYAADRPIETSSTNISAAGEELHNEDHATNTNLNNAHLASRLRRVLSDRSSYRRLLLSKASDAQVLLDLFQSLLDGPALDTQFRRSLIVATQRLCKKSGLYPVCYELKGVQQDESGPITAGGFADIYKGDFEGHTVCLKAIRVYQDSQLEHLLKQFSKEVIIWRQLSHPNVLPMYGLYRFKRRLCLVAPWMENGDVGAYLKQNPGADRLSLVADVAEGLLYLHRNNIIHGDLKGPNILVDDVGRARVCDFGISCVSDPEIVAWTSLSSMSSKGGSLRWQAPELFDMENDEAVKNSTSSDVYALGCVCYEVGFFIFTGNVPFHNVSRDAAVMLQIQRGTRPSRPPQSSLPWRKWGLTENIWAVIQECWGADPLDRPTTEQVINRLSLPSRRDDHSGFGLALSPMRFRGRMSEPLDEVSKSAAESLLRDLAESMLEYKSEKLPSSSLSDIEQTTLNGIGSSMIQEVDRNVKRSFVSGVDDKTGRDNEEDPTSLARKLKLPMPPSSLLPPDNDYNSGFPSLKVSYSSDDSEFDISVESDGDSDFLADHSSNVTNRNSPSLKPDTRFQHKRPRLRKLNHLRGGEPTWTQVPAEESTNPTSTVQCFNCDTTATPLWRKDDVGNDLCNACESYYKLHGSSRPHSMKSAAIPIARRRTTQENSERSRFSMPSTSLSSSSDQASPAFGASLTHLSPKPPTPALNYSEGFNYSSMKTELLASLGQELSQSQKEMSQHDIILWPPSDHIMPHSLLSPSDIASDFWDDVGMRPRTKKRRRMSTDMDLSYNDGYSTSSSYSSSLGSPYFSAFDTAPLKEPSHAVWHPPTSLSQAKDTNIHPPES
ncbi:hypothetical protein DXG01_010373 [Tephrocybe rancida]|nr:hypothetical protein DXG01_010373 [Tephrocybe rancida]